MNILAKLMNDIDFQHIENLHEPIGPNTGRKFNGIFDGQGYAGALTHKLNGDQTTITWFQNLDNGQSKDVYPSFDPSHSTVYVKANMKCDGSFDADEATYSNNNEVVIPDHKFVDGICSECGHEQEDYPFLAVFANADHDVTTGYVNENSADGSGLAINNSVAEHWNQQWFTTYQPVSGLQKGIYKLRVQGLSRVKVWDNAEGEPYSNGVLDADFIPLYHNSQYYAEIGGKRVANLFMDIAEGRQPNSFGETENFNEVSGAYVPNSLAACNKYFGKGLYWNEPIYFAVESENDTVNIGVENRIYLQGNWTVWDTWRLEYVGEITDEHISLIRKQQSGNIQVHQTFRTPDGSRNFVTPQNNRFAYITNGGSDFQMVGGEFRIILDPTAGTVVFEPIEYIWHDNVFVVGSLIDQNGAQHRYKNDETAPLAHKGNGVYEGTVTFYEDPNNPGVARFTIFANRSTLAETQYSTVTRSNWTEARYGSDTNELSLEEGATLTDLIRGQDRNWRIAWEGNGETQAYVITFDMNAHTLTIKKHDDTAIEEVKTDKVPLARKGIFTLSGQRVEKPTRGLYIIDGKKVLVK